MNIVWLMNGLRRTPLLFHLANQKNKLPDNYLAVFVILSPVGSFILRPFYALLSWNYIDFYVGYMILAFLRRRLIWAFMDLYRTYIDLRNQEQQFRFLVSFYFLLSFIFRVFQDRSPASAPFPHQFCMKICELPPLNAALISYHFRCVSSIRRKKNRAGPLPVRLCDVCCSLLYLLLCLEVEAVAVSVLRCVIYKKTANV